MVQAKLSWLCIEEDIMVKRAVYWIRLIKNDRTWVAKALWEQLNTVKFELQWKTQIGGHNRESLYVSA